MTVDRKNSVASTSTTASGSLHILLFILVGSFLPIFDPFVIHVAAPAIITSGIIEFFRLPQISYHLIIDNEIQSR